ncbi:MAG: MarR family winged helix-turn-helix transcriptional regulator [Pleomorphochaeta sp.]
MSNYEDIEILENSLFTIKQISSLLKELEQIINNNEETKDGLTKRQAEVLLYLYQLPNPPSIRELSRYLSTSHQNIKKICLLLEKENYVRFVEDIKDKRKTRIKLTIKGDNKAGEINKALNKIAKKISNDFQSSEIDEIARLLRKLQFAIDNENMNIRKNFNN